MVMLDMVSYNVLLKVSHGKLEVKNCYAKVVLTIIYILFFVTGITYVM